MFSSALPSRIITLLLSQNSWVHIERGAGRKEGGVRDSSTALKVVDLKHLTQSPCTSWSLLSPGKSSGFSTKGHHKS